MMRRPGFFWMIPRPWTRIDTPNAVTSSDRWRRIEQVFTAALELPRGERDKYLESACGNDVDLRQEVESLIARDYQEGDTEPSPVISGIIEGTAASLFDDETPRDSMVGAELGNYRITREIGRGGMGAVYLAVRADRTFEKQVAIKLVKRGIDTDAVLQRFWHERRILAGLEHPFIARLVDGGTSPDGRPYFVMEYVDGKPLDVFVNEQSLSVRDCCELFRKICEAIAYAHRNLIIHRDLKPANVLVTADGTPKLLDFGIARLLSVDPDEHTIAGPVGIHALTPEFASPEQVRGEAITTATDVYSLGSTLRATLPSGVPLPTDVATIVGKAMREESDERYASVADFSEDLRRYLNGLPILAREQTLAYQASRFVRRHRFGVGVVALAFLLLFGGVAGIVWEARKAATERRAAEQRLSQAVEMAERTLKDVNSSIASLPGTTEARRQMVRSTLDYLNRLAKDSGDDPRVLTALATAYVRVGEVLGNPEFPNLGDVEGSLATYQRAVAVVQPLLADDPDNIRLQQLASLAHQGAGNVLVSLGRNTEAETELLAAITLADQALARSPQDSELQYQSLDAHYALDMHNYTAQPAEAEKDARKLLPVAEKLAAAYPDDLDKQNKLSEFYSMLGTSANRLYRLDESLSYYRKAAEAREAIYRQHPRNTKIQRNLMIGYGHIGDILGNPFTGCLGDYPGALEYYQKAADIAEEMKRADPSDQRAGFDMGMIWTRIGATRQAAGDLRGSNEDLDRSIAQFETLMKVSPGNAAYSRGFAIAYEFRGRNTWLLGDRQAARVQYQKSLDLTNQLIAARGADVSALVQQIADEGPIADLMALAGDRAGAIKLADKMLKTAEGLRDQRRDLHVAQSYKWYAQAYEALHDFETAADAYQKSADTWKALLAGISIPPYDAQMEEALQKAAECRKRIPEKARQPSSPGAL
jgi:serine/threonine protein kinase